VDWDGILAGTRPVRLAGTLRRLVESQEQVATNQLVSSLARQARLEEMLEATKPPRRPDSEGLHYLLATPFRYPPLRYGSRFGARHEPSLFYGAVETRTVLAEAAYYRFVFWQGMAVPPPGKLDTQHTLFSADYRTGRGLRLQDAPFAGHTDALRDPANYHQTQTLGARLRAAGIEAFEYRSARDREAGIDVALFTPAAFAHPRPRAQDAWLCELTARQVQFRAAQGGELHAFPLEQFLVDGALPWLAL
jgi:hypothetical protein